MYMYVRMCMYMYQCIYVYVCVCICIHIYVYTCMRVYVYIHMCICVCICTSPYVFLRRVWMHLQVLLNTMHVKVCTLDRCCEHQRTHLLHARYRMCICAIYIHVYMQICMCRCVWVAAATPTESQARLGIQTALSSIFDTRTHEHDEGASGSASGHLSPILPFVHLPHIVDLWTSSSCFVAWRKPNMFVYWLFRLHILHLTHLITPITRFRVFLQFLRMFTPNSIVVMYSKGMSSTGIDRDQRSGHRSNTSENPPKWQENDLVSGGHGQAGSWRGQWNGWIGSAPVQISGCGLDGALSWCGQGEGRSFLVSSWAARAVAAAPSFQTCFACVHMHILYACVYICVCVHVCGHVYICIYWHVCMYMYMYAFIHVCMCMMMIAFIITLGEIM